MMINNMNEKNVVSPFKNVNIEVFSEQQNMLGKTLKFQFYGNATEYFSIWIVNLCLTILTLGFYSPWAKVRRLRYFYGNSEFYQRRFDFTGIPHKILIGRIIAFILLVVVTLIGEYSLSLLVVGWVLIYAISPWLIRATMRFNSRNSKFGNNRLFFSGTNQQAYKEFMLGGIIYVFSFGIFSPVLIWLYKRYIFNHLHIGQLKFKLHARWEDYMGAVYLPIFILIGLMLVSGLSMLMLGSVLGLESILILLFVLYPLIFIFIYPLIMARVFIVTWNNVSLSQSKFQTNANQWRFTWIVGTNWILRILSLGLLTAWAAIRIYQYKLESLSLTLHDDPDHLYNLAQHEPNALAEEITDLFDIDVSL